jgi:thiamine pyrophosphate-dependent acetolactate synthase large subunit-like protein
VGLAFAVGAKAAKPEAQVICLHGDGSFGRNAMEVDTAARHKLPLLCVISLNGGWTADSEGNKPGRYLGCTRYEKIAEALGCYAEYVEEPEDIRPALQRAWKKVEEGMVGFCQRQDRLPRPRDDRALFQPRDLKRPFLFNGSDASRAPFSAGRGSPPNSRL